jgi:hypothetical protein
MADRWTVVSSDTVERVVKRLFDLMRDEMGVTPDEAMTLLVLAQWKLCQANDVGVEEGVEQIVDLFRSVHPVDGPLQ